MAKKEVVVVSKRVTNATNKAVQCVLTQTTALLEALQKNDRKKVVKTLVKLNRCTGIIVAAQSEGKIDLINTELS